MILSLLIFHSLYFVDLINSMFDLLCFDHMNGKRILIGLNDHDRFIHFEIYIEFILTEKIRLLIDFMVAN